MVGNVITGMVLSYGGLRVLDGDIQIGVLAAVFRPPVRLPCSAKVGLGTQTGLCPEIAASDERSRSRPRNRDAVRA